MLVYLDYWQWPDELEERRTEKGELGKLIKMGRVDFLCFSLSLGVV